MSKNLVPNINFYSFYAFYAEGKVKIHTPALKGLKEEGLLAAK